MLAYVIDEMSGAELGKLLEEMVDKRWTLGVVHKFALHGEIAFEISVLRHSNEPGNGRISFLGNTPSWDRFLDSTLTKGFRANYERLQRYKLKEVIESEVFQTFVMIQFEVARRVIQEDRTKFPDRNQVAEAIKHAVSCDCKEKYKLLVEVFRGEKRMKCYEALCKAVS